MLYWIAGNVCLARWWAAAADWLHAPSILVAANWRCERV
jgi:hypothetical protein